MIVNRASVSSRLPLVTAPSLAPAVEYVPTTSRTPQPTRAPKASPKPKASPTLQDSPSPQSSPPPQSSPAPVPSVTGPSPECAALKLQIAGYIREDEKKKTALIANAVAIQDYYLSNGTWGDSASIAAMAANKKAYDAVVKDEAHWKAYNIPGC